MDVIMGKIINECDSKYAILRGRVAKQRENIKRKYLWEKKCEESKHFPEKQIVQSCPCSHRGCFMAEEV